MEPLQIKEESVLLDFSNSFKSGTRGFGKKAKKGVKKQMIEKEDGREEEKVDDANKDLEDMNMLIEN